MKEEWKEFHDMMKANRQERHAEWKELNTKVITEVAAEQGITFKIMNQGESLLFREKGKPMCDFYPSTGRWRVVGSEGKGKAMRGGAVAFLAWYSKQCN
jgi:hypothetical protein